MNLNPLSILLNEFDTIPESVTYNEGLVRNYLQKTRLETILLLAIKPLLKDQILPKNPYFKIIRSLKVSNSQKEIVDSFENIIQKFKVNNIPEGNREYSIVPLNEKKNIWGNYDLLEWVNQIRIERLYYSLIDILPEFDREGENYTV